MTIELAVGTLVDSQDSAPAHLDPARFNRHTFWCGQSGSGKTYALGVVLEQLLLHTRLPLLILDPNGDFVRMGETRAEVHPEVAALLAAVEPRVFRPRRDENPLTVRFLDLDLRSMAAALRLDPLRDPDEFNVLLHLRDDFVAGARADKDGLSRMLRDSDDPGRRRLFVRLQNLGILDWDVLAWGGHSVEEVIETRPRATVLDLGGFNAADESKLAALAVLDRLWATREERKPVLVVIDEAHNLCPAQPLTPLDTALAERIVQIAAEGRKYGLWLLLSTQRPSKIHPNALSQCDNLGLMKMSSPRDLAELGDYFGFAPAELLARSGGFAQGQALFAGGFIPTPSIIQVASRLTHEGGSDVRVPL